MRIMVTGGAGYIGSHAVRRLREDGHDVVVYDNLGRGHREAVPAGLLVEGDLADTPLLERTLRERSIEAVLHFAAFAMVGESVAHPELYYRNNVLGSFSLLEAMRGAGVRRIVFSSTTATYGIPQRVPIREDEPQLPINPYGHSKRFVEQMLSDYAVAHGFGYAALRYFNAAGAHPSGELGEDPAGKTRLIALALQVAYGQLDKLQILGDDYPTPDGTCIRDYVHVDDLIDAHVRALPLLTPGVELRLNLGTGRGYSVREVIDSCRRVTGREIPCEVGPRRPGDPPELVADPTAAREQLGWIPRYQEIDSIVETAWRWHCHRPNGYCCGTVSPPLRVK